MAIDGNRNWFSIFRFVFGVLIMFGVSRFWYYNWIEELYIIPSFHFRFPGLDFIRILPGWLMHGLFIVMFGCGLAIAGNVYYRPACLLFFIAFTYIELIDVTYYLNHYYLVSLLSFTMIFYDSKQSADTIYNQQVLSFLKLQISIVYFFGGINKIGYDWLVKAEPLKIWLYANSNLPLLGKLLADEKTAYVAAWLSMLFDVSVAFMLWFHKTRVAAYIMLSVFHILTALLFNIGIFPWVMMTGALLFFSRAIPLRKLFSIQPNQPRAKLAIAVLSCVAVWQLLFPMRHFLRSENYLWTERGFRFSWNIMLMEKNGTIEFAARDTSGKLEDVNEQSMLTPFQLKMMSTQPDLILQFAHHIQKANEEKGKKIQAVFADAQVSLNGRSATTYFGPEINLLNRKDELYKSIIAHTPAR